METPGVARVFVANLANLDYTKAEQFGILQPLTKHYVRFNDIESLTVKISQQLSQVNPNLDYLILSGNNLICALVLHLWMKRFNYARILHWDTRSERYAILTIGTDVLHIIQGASDDLETGVEVQETRQVGEV